MKGPGLRRTNGVLANRKQPRLKKKKKKKKKKLTEIVKIMYERIFTQSIGGTHDTFRHMDIDIGP